MKRVVQNGELELAALMHEEMILARVLIFALSGVAVTETVERMLPPPAALIVFDGIARPVAASARIATVLGRLRAQLARPHFSSGTNSEGMSASKALPPQLGTMRRPA